MIDLAVDYAENIRAAAAGIEFACIRIDFPELFDLTE